MDNIDRPRAKLALKYLRAANNVAQWVTMSRYQERFIREYLGITPPRIQWIGDQTDTEFFTPGPPSPGKRRPIVACVGLEQRDFRTLALATHDLDIDVHLTAFSGHTRKDTRAFPDMLPANMHIRSYSWLELAQLYRDADLVVLSLFDNKYCAGITTLLEALSCRRPVVVTKTRGLEGYLDPEMAVVVPPTDAGALRDAIAELLDDGRSAEQLAASGHAAVLAQYTNHHKLNALANLLDCVRRRGA